MFENGRRTVTYTVVLRSGRVDAYTGGKSAVLVATPQAANAMIQSGHGGVSNAHGRVAIASFGGEVSTLRGGRYSPLAQGTVAVIDAGHLEQRPLLSPPEPARFPQVLVAASDAVRIEHASWRGVPGADAYRVRFEDEKGALIGERKEDFPKLTVPFSDVPPGATAW